MNVGHATVTQLQGISVKYFEECLKCLVTKTESFLRRIRWKAYHFYMTLIYHCEGSRGLGLRFGLRLGLGLGLTFNCTQSFKSRLFEPLFLATFKVFFTVN